MPDAAPALPVPPPAGPAFSPGAAISTSFRVYGRALWAFAAVGALFLSPALLLDVGVGRSRGTAQLSQILWSVLRALVMAGVTQGTLDALRGRTPSWKRMVAVGLRRGARVFGAAFVAGIITLLGLVLLVIPGLVAVAGLYVAEPAAATEDDLTARESISRSWGLTRGHRWGTLAMLLLFLALTYCALIVATLLAGAATTLLAARALTLAGELVVTAAIALQGVAAAVAYHGLRTEKEGVEAPVLAAVFE